jgi:hypothetical protein
VDSQNIVMEDMLNRVLKKHGKGSLQDENLKSIPEEETTYNDGLGGLGDISRLKGPVG